MKKKVANYMWTKEGIKKMIKLWEESSIQDIADALGIEKKNVQYMAMQIRKAGGKLPRKHHTGHIQSLIKEVLKEIR